MAEITQTALSTQRSVPISNAHPRLPYKATLFFFVFSLSFLFISCSHNPVDPGEILTPGRRDYVWTVDTTTRFNGNLSKVCGDNLNNMWFTELNGSFVKLWHYFYGNWVAEQRITEDIEKIYQYDSTNIWAFSGTGNAYQYNGLNWIYRGKFKDTLPGRHYFTNVITTKSLNKFYTGGGYMEKNRIYAILLFYNGNEWEPYNVKIGANRQVAGVFVDDISPVGLIVERDQNFEEYSLARIYADRVEVVCTGNDSTAVYPFQLKYQQKIYIYLGRILYKLEKNELIQITNIDLPEYAYYLSGRTEMDLFCPTAKGIAHYNGSDFVYIYNYNGNSHIRVTDIWFSTTEVCILCFDLVKNINIVIRGKLK